MKKLNLIKKEQIKDSKTVDICEEDIDMDFFEGMNGIKFENGANYKMAIRGGCEFEGKAIYLKQSYNYIVGEDSDGMPILVPLKKGL